MSVPEELRALDQWVCWKYRNGTKVPCASSTDPETWTSFRAASARYRAAPELYAGIGFVFSPGDPYVGVDLDDCLDGVLEPWAADILDTLGGYQEISPSGTGVKVWVRSSLERAYKTKGIEIYPHSRFFAVTGNVLRECSELPDVDDAISSVITDFGLEARKSKDAPPECYSRTLIDMRAFMEEIEVQILDSKKDRSAEVFSIECPWAFGNGLDPHSYGDITGTRVGQFPNGARFFECEHKHGVFLGWHYFVHYFGYEDDEHYRLEGTR